jgi:hypothetical protein
MDTTADFRRPCRQSKFPPHVWPVIHHIFRGLGHPNVDCLCTEKGVPRPKNDNALRFSGSHPNCPDPADERERVLSHYLSRTLERQFDGAGGKGARSAELVRYAQDYTGCVDAIAE